MDKIIILGRGASLERLKEFKNEDNIDTIILVNEFWGAPHIPLAYCEDELIHNFIKDKKIILIMTPYCEARKWGDVPKLKLFKETYNVIDSYKTQFSKETRVGKNSEICKILPDELIKPFKHMDKHSLNCGSLGVALSYADKILKCKNIIIFGLDFYEKEYYLTNTHDYKTEMKISNTIKNDWYNFFEYHSHIHFTIYSLAEISHFNNLNNVTI